jgi:general secretion pathway protein A
MAVLHKSITRGIKMQSTLNRLSTNLRSEFREGQPSGDRYERIFHFFGLRENPFNIGPDPRYLSFNPQIQEALNAITCGIRTGQDLVLLTGEAGTGKTTLTNYLLSWLRQRQIPTSFIFNSRLNVNDLFDLVMFDFGIACESEDKSIKRSLLIAWLLTRCQVGKTPILIVDEAQGLPSAVLEEIRVLLNQGTSQEKLLQIVLVGQPELEQKLARSELRQLRQRTTVHCKIGLLNSAETGLYIHRRLRVAGARDEPIFVSDALNAVHSHSCGIPRLINILCEHALIDAYTYQIRPVTPKIVNEVAREFQFDKMASLDTRLDFDKITSTRPISTRSIPTTRRAHSVELAEPATREHCNSVLSHAPVPALQKNPAAPLVPLTNHLGIANATMAQRVAAWRRWMLNPLFPPSSYPSRQWLDENNVMLRFPILHQTAMSVVHWLQRPVRPVRAIGLIKARLLHIRGARSALRGFAAISATDSDEIYVSNETEVARLSSGSPIDSTGKVKMNTTKSMLACIAIALLATFMISLVARSQPQAPQVAGTVITEVEVGRTENHTIVRVVGNGRLLVRALRLSSPERLVLDFDQVHFSLAHTSVLSTLRPVRGVRVGQFEANVARVVIDLDGKVPYSMKSEGQSITVVFLPNSAENASPIKNSAISTAPLKQPSATSSATSTRSTASLPVSQVASNVSATPGSSTASEQVVDTLQNSFEHGMLTFRAKNQSLRSILDQIGQSANVVIDVAEGLGKEKISVEFRHYRLDEALRQMLKQYKSLFLYGADKGSTGDVSLAIVWVYPPDQGPGMDPFSMGMFKANTKRIEQTLTDPNLEQTLTDPNPQVRAHAVDSLIRRQGRQSVGVVLDALRDPSERVREQVLYRALSMGVEISEDTLIGLALNDESSNVRVLALQALPVKLTLRWVAERASTDSTQQIREAATDILQEFDSVNADSGLAANKPGAHR